MDTYMNRIHGYIHDSSRFYIHAATSLYVATCILYTFTKIGTDGKTRGLSKDLKNFSSALLVAWQPKHIDPKMRSSKVRLCQKPQELP